MPVCASNARKRKNVKRPAANNMRKLILFIIIILAVTVLDQATKLWAEANLVEGQTRQVWGDFFQVKLLYNEGGVMGSSLGGSTFYLISSLCVFSFVVYFLYVYRNLAIVAIPMCIIAGGAVGNIIDRIRLGQVVDFLDFDFFDISIGSFHLERWWTFNISDAAISVGVVWLIIYLLFFYRAPQTQEVASAEDSFSA